MSVEFTIPELGENVDKGDVVRVLVNKGDTVAKDQPVIELETDKATIEVPSNVGGVVTDIKVKPGDKVKVGQVVLVLEGNGAGAEAAPKPEEKPQDKPQTTDAAEPARPAAPAEASPKPAERAKTDEPQPPTNVVDIASGRHAAESPYRFTPIHRMLDHRRRRRTKPATGGASRALLHPESSRPLDRVA